MALELRPYQRELIQRTRAAALTGKRRILIQAPTGAGKTCLIAHMLAAAAAKQKRAWFIVHRRELLEQSIETLRVAANLLAGTIASGLPTIPEALIQVCSAQTLVRRLSALTPPDLVVFDEAHHQAANTWKALAHFTANAGHIGLTATPIRLDGKGLKPFFDALVCGPTTAELIAQGYLSPYKLFAPGNHLDLEGVRTVGGDYNKHQLDVAMQRATVTGDALTQYLKHVPTGRALMFIWSVLASKELAARLQMAGLAAAHLDGETPMRERIETMNRFRAGDLRVLCNVDLFGEGLDVPAVDAIFLLRPTKSLGLYLQQIGRGLRPAPDKSHVKIFDHAHNYLLHGLPDDPHAWTLTDDRYDPKPDVEVDRVRRCKACFAVMSASAAICPACGVVVPPGGRKVQRVDGELEEITASERRRRYGPRRTLADWEGLARSKGYKRGWAWHRWREQEGLPH